MKIPFFWMALGFCIGILAHDWFLFSPHWVWAVLLFGFPFLWLSRNQKFFIFLLLTQFALLGYLYSYAAYKRPPNAIEAWSHADRMSLEGIVHTSPEIKTQGKKVTVSFVLSSRNLMHKQNGLRSFHKTQGDVQVFLFNPSRIPEFGDRVRMWGELETPREILNPGEFDYGKYLAERKIYVVFRGFGKNSLRIMRHGEAFLDNISDDP